MDRFSLRYLKPDTPLTDSERMRIRLDAAVEQIIPAYDDWEYLAVRFRAQLGIRLGNEVRPFEDLELRDVLDGVTVVLNFFRDMDDTRPSYDRKPRSEKWLRFVEKVFREEHLGYRVDEAGVVHFAADEAFEQDRASTLSGLGAPRYASARKAFEDGFSALRGDSPNGKAAIQGVFTAVETVFKLMFDKAPRLGGAETKTFLKPVVARTYAGDATSLRSMEKATESFMGWIEAVHWYRHAQGQEEPVEPPLETTVLLVSQGSAFLRWLMTVDAAKQEKAGTAA